MAAVRYQTRRRRYDLSPMVQFSSIIAPYTDLRVPQATGVWHRYPDLIDVVQFCSIIAPDTDLRVPQATAVWHRYPDLTDPVQFSSIIAPETVGCPRQQPYGTATAGSLRHGANFAQLVTTARVQA